MKANAAFPSHFPMFSPALLEHFRNPRNAGVLPSPAVTVTVENPACGDLLRLSVEWSQGRVAHVRYQVKGCTASIAAGSALTELMAGRSRRELASLDAAAVEQALGGLTAETKHAAVLCVDGLSALLRQSTEV